MAARFEILGPLAAGADGRDVVLPRGLPSAILAGLIAEPNRTIPTDELVDALWGATPPRTAANTLQVHVATLRRALRDASPALAERLVTDRAGYRLRVEPGELDGEVFASELGAAQRADRASADASTQTLRRALTRWHGPVLDGIDLRTPGGDAAAARFDELRLAAIELLAELELRMGRAAIAATELSDALAVAPFRERLHALLMLALYRAGRQADALAAYQRARSTLADELGIDPGPELRALELAILRHDPGLRGDVLDRDLGALGSGPSLGGLLSDVALPSPGTTFVGRDAELRQFADRIARERLVTVVAVGGAGKTRFAIEAAARIADRFDGGVRFVDLGAIPDGEAIVAAIAGAWAIAEQPGRDLLGAVGASLGDQRRLLVLDTCEAIAGSVADTATRLLALAPGLTILATSREPLRLDLELVWHLPPLGAVDDRRDREQLLGDDAVRLFVERAERVRPDRAWAEADLRTIARICRRLDGLPLAIEMAAARSMVLTPADIEDRLDDRFRLLTGRETGAAVERHRTLRATFDWSYELLGPAERETLRHLSIFATAVSPGAVAAVCTTAAAPDATALTIALAERSLVVTSIDAAGRSRFGLLDTVREYARALLADPDEAAIARRYVGYWIAVAQGAYDRRIAEADAQATGLEAERDELRAAVDRAHALDPALELRLVGLLGWFWAHHTHVLEGRRVLDRALSAPVDDDLSRARALTARGTIASAQADAAVAEADLSAALSLWRAQGDRVETCVTLDGLGWARFWAGDNDGSMAAFEAAVKLAEELAIPAVVRRAKAGLGQVVVAVGDVARARPLAEELIRLAAGDLWAAHLGRHYLADCALMDGDPATALSRYREALVLANAMGNATETAIEVEGVAMALAGLGDHRTGVELYAAADANLAALGVDISGVPFWHALGARYLGPARVALGDEAPEVEASGRRLSLSEVVAFSAASAAVPIV